MAVLFTWESRWDIKHVDYRLILHGARLSRARQEVQHPWNYTLSDSVVPDNYDNQKPPQISTCLSRARAPLLTRGLTCCWQVLRSASASSSTQAQALSSCSLQSTQLSSEVMAENQVWPAAPAYNVGNTCVSFLPENPRWSASWGGQGEPPDKEQQQAQHPDSWGNAHSWPILHSKTGSSNKFLELDWHIPQF